MKKTILTISVLVLALVVGAQQLETTIKIVGGKARIALKATGGSFTSVLPSNYVFVVSIPKANGDAGAVLTVPTKLDATVPTGPTLNSGALPTYSDAGTDLTYFLLFYQGAGTTPRTFADGVEVDILELNFTVTSGGSQNFPVSLMSLPGGNASAPVGAGQWQHFLEIGGAEASASPPTWFYATAPTSIVSSAIDGSTGTAQVSTVNTIVILPVHILNFSGYKNGNKNKLLWATATEENSRGFEIQRSIDGVNYSSIGFVNSQAAGGSSNSTLSYSFDDNSPVGKRQYYRLSQEDFDGRNRTSNTVMIKGDLSATLAIGGLFPNPARSTVNLIIDAPKRDNVMVLVTDLAGKIVKQQPVNVSIGSNTIPVDIARLASGSYLVRLTCQASECELAAGRFNKQ